MKGKQITLYPIYCKQKETNAHLLKTQISFTTEEEAKRYCKYLNRNDIHGDTLTFSYKVEKTMVFKTSSALISDPNEDQVLFENYIDTTTLAQ